MKTKKYILITLGLLLSPMAFGQSWLSEFIQGLKGPNSQVALSAQFFFSLKNPKKIMRKEASPVNLNEPSNPRAKLRISQYPPNYSGRQ